MKRYFVVKQSGLELISCIDFSKHEHIHRAGLAMKWENNQCDVQRETKYGM